MFYALGSVEVSAAPYLWTILTLFTACVLTLAVAALLDSNAENGLVHAGQRVRLSRTRMRRMLKRRHVNLGAYARSLTVAEMKDQISTCQHCGLTDLCDRALESRGPSRSAFSFCPNRPAIERHLFPLARLHV